MKHIFLLLTSLITLGLAAKAEDGSSLWLRTQNTSTPTETLTKGFKASDPTIIIAAEELNSLDGGNHVTFKKNKHYKNDEYSIVAREGGIEIEAASPIGILYGTYDLLRRNALGEDLTAISTKESPAYVHRLLNHWDNPNGTVERGYAGNSIWKWDELPAVISPKYKEYARACASVGINGAVLNNVNAKPQTLTSDNIKKVKAIADVLRPYGIKVYLSVNFASPKALGDLSSADPNLPEVQKWWKDKADEIYTLIPDFGGFLVKANSEGEPGPGDYGRSHSEGANMLARALKPHGGIIMWRAFVYSSTSPDRAMQAYEEFKPLDGQFDDNVIIQIKNGPVDFQPREPFSPLFGTMPKTQQMVEFQITQEYLGASNHLVYLAPLFKETLDANTYREGGSIKAITSTPLHDISAIAGVANIGDDTNWCGHDFAQANWYAFGRLAWNPELSSEQIAKEWLGQTFNNAPEFLTPASDMMLKSREAAVNYMMPIGLHHIFAGNHHYGPEPWYFPEGIRIDWTPIYYHKADSNGIGFDRTVATGSGATQQYAYPLSDKFENNCPIELLLWFHHVGWNDTLSTGNTLWEEMCSRYSDGVDSAREFQKTWDNLEHYVDRDRFKAVQSKLKIQAHDAQWWKDACLLYFQEMNQLPFPEDMERPVYDFDYLKQVHIPLGLYGCPTRDMLP